MQRIQHTVVLLSALLLASSARADDRVTLGGLVGAHLFSDTVELGAFDSSDADSPRNSIAFGIRAGYQLFERLRLEGELALMPARTAGGGGELGARADAEGRE